MNRSDLTHMIKLLSQKRHISDVIIFLDILITRYKHDESVLNEVLLYYSGTYDSIKRRYDDIEVDIKKQVNIFFRLYEKMTKIKDENEGI